MTHQLPGSVFVRQKTHPMTFDNCKLEQTGYKSGNCYHKKYGKNQKPTGSHPPLALGFFDEPGFFFPLDDEAIRKCFSEFHIIDIEILRYKDTKKIKSKQIVPGKILTDVVSPNITLSQYLSFLISLY
jgi:hypothetical protein